MSALAERGVAIVRDAAHGQPPILGQGAGLTLMNAHALAVALERNRTVGEALPAWEAAVRFNSLMRIADQGLRLTAMESLTLAV
jgi:2-polyprenyl-6-methoxyphenol hydroxylase-like FAD-dependent oxidoreductase